MMVTWGALTVMVAGGADTTVPGLLLVEVTVAVLFSVPLKPAAVVPVTTKVTEAPAARVPRLSVMVLLLNIAAGKPVVVVMPVQLTPVGAGKGSLTLTL